MYLHFTVQHSSLSLSVVVGCLCSSSSSSRKMSPSNAAVPRGASPPWGCQTTARDFQSAADSSSKSSSSNSSSSSSSSSSSMGKNSKNFRGLLCLLGGILLHIALGTVYTFGVSSIYFISYIKNNNDPTLRVTAAATLMAAEFSAMALGMPLGGALERKMGPKLYVHPNCCCCCWCCGWLLLRGRKNMRL